MADQKISIVSWPQEKASVEHHFDAQAPVSISFANPAMVAINTSEEQPAHVHMELSLSARAAVPVTVRLADPLVARSEYTVSLDIFDRPVATLTLRGQTTLVSAQASQGGSNDPT